MKIGRVYEVFQTDFKYTEHYLARELNRMGHTTVFITSDKYLNSWERYLKTKEGIGFHQHDDFEVVRLDAFFPKEKAIFKNPLHLAKVLLEFDFDILHLYGVGSFSTVMVLWLTVFLGKRVPPIIISDHGDTRTHTREGRLADAYYRFFALQLIFLKKRIFRIVTFSSVGRNLLSRRFNLPLDRFQVIPLGYDQDNYRFQPELKNKEEKMVLGYAGKISPKKRVDFLIRVLSTMEIAEQLRLVVVGYVDDDPYCKQLRALAEETSLEVEFRPFASKEELASFYNYVDLAVYPGGISITTIEASGCGTPVIIYESIADLEERVENGRGHLFKTEEELRYLLAYYYHTMYLEGKMNNLQIEQATREVNSWSSIKEQYLELYKEAQYERQN